MTELDDFLKDLSAWAYGDPDFATCIAIIERQDETLKVITQTIDNATKAMFEHAETCKLDPLIRAELAWSCDYLLKTQTDINALLKERK